MAGISLVEAADWDADEAKGLLGWVQPICPQATPLPQTQHPTGGGGCEQAQAARERQVGVEGDVAFSPACLRTPPIQPKETTMARGRKKQEEKVEVVGKPDFERAIQLYREDIRPAQAKVGEYAQEQSTAYKEIKKGCNIHPGAAKLAFKLDQMEDAKRDDFLRSLYGLMAALKIGISADLVDQMGDDEAPRMPVAERQTPGLMALN
jgi:hypothetical protein